MPVPIMARRTFRPRAQAGVCGSRLLAATAALAAMNSLRFMANISPLGSVPAAAGTPGHANGIT